MRKVIPLSNQRFASCSGDKTIKIWKDDNTYKCISTFEHSGWVRAILQIKGKEVLVLCRYTLSGITFWNTNNYTKLHTIEGFKVDVYIRIIEVCDGYITISSKDFEYSIVIIDISSYQIVTMIKLEEYIYNPSLFFMSI